MGTIRWDRGDSSFVCNYVDKDAYDWLRSRVCIWKNRACVPTFFISLFSLYISKKIYCSMFSNARVKIGIPVQRRDGFRRRTAVHSDIH